ncbi:hypothetical protein ACFL57_05285, partial [Candidatus Margulisiibacteriota bacterium]
QFRIFDQLIGGAQLWATTNVQINVVQGVYNVELGDAGNPISPNALAGDSAYLEIQVGDDILVPRQKINSVGYALQAGAVTGEENVFPSDGNVGIGTVAPELSLHVKKTGSGGVIKVENDGGGYSFGVDGAGGYVQTAGTAAYSIWSGGTRVAYFNNDGDVGIGDADPATKLEVAGTVSANAFSGDGSGLTGISTTDTGWDHTASENIVLGSNYLSGDGGDEGVFVKSDGNVGIGTTNPEVKLQLSQSTGPFLRVENTDTTMSNGETYGGLEFYGSDNSNPGSSDGLRGKIELISNIPSTTGESAMVFYIAAGNVIASERMRITKTGNVGIGTTAPIVRTSYVAPWLTISSAAPGIALVDNNSADRTKFFSSSAGVLNIGMMDDDGTNPSVQMAIRDDGTVGIGNASPTGLLHVSANALVVNSDGKVGIGTTAPRAKLDTAGVIRALSTTIVNPVSGEGLEMYFGSGSGYIVSSERGGTYKPLRFYASEYNFNNGNVGIGTTNPSFLLDINKSPNTDTGGLRVANVNASGIYAATLENIHSGGYGLSVRGGGNGTAALRVVNAASTTNAFFVMGNGNVGIGTGAPLSKLVIADSVLNRDLHFGLVSPGYSFIQSTYRNSPVDGSAPRGLLLNPYNSSAGQGAVGIGTTAVADGINLQVSTNSLVVLNNGRVGIGTTAPAYKLDVKSSIATAATGTARINAYLNGSGDGLVINTNTRTTAENSVGALRVIDRYGNEAFRVNVGGNVGIGMTAPGGKFVVESDSGVAHTFFQNSNTSDGYNGGTMVAIRNSGKALYNKYLSFIADYDGDEGGLVNFGALAYTSSNTFSIWNPSGGNIVLQKDNGNVGIGTVAPGSILHIEGSDANEYITLKNTGTSGREYLIANGNSGSSYGVGLHIIDNTASGTSRLSIDDGGNVGIGTADPGDRLDVKGNIRLSDGAPDYKRKVQYYYDASHYNSIEFYSPSSGGMLFDMAHASSGGYDFQWGGASVMLIDANDGNVGIGTTDPTNRLVVKAASAVTEQTIKVLNDAGNTVGSVGKSGEDGIIYVNDASGVSKIQIFANPAGDTYFNAGNVGIGTASPAEKLEVNGAIKVGAGVLGEDPGTMYYDSGAGKMMYRSTSNWVTLDGGGVDYSGTLWTENGGNVYRESGYVGIGLTNPTEKLVVDAGTGVGLKLIGANGNFTIQDGSLIDTTRSTMYFGFNDASNFNFNNGKFYVKDDGTVGIGTNAPAHELEISSTTPIFRITDSDSDGDAAISWMEFYDQNSRVGYIGDGSQFNQDLYFIAESADLHLGDSSGATVLNLNGGKVGIGITNPEGTLEVAHATGSSYLYLNSLGATGTPGFYFKKNGSYIGSMKSSINLMENGPGDSIVWNSYTGGFHFHSNIESFGLVVSSNGSVGIGTTAPGRNLEIFSTQNAHLRIARGGSTYWDIGLDSGSGILDFKFDGSDKLRLNYSSGDLILPEGILEIGTYSQYGPIEGSSWNQIARNAYNSSGWKYTNTDAASLIEMGDQISFFTAPSGTADTGITWTRAMTVNDGSVGIGTTAPDTKLEVKDGYVLFRDESGSGSHTGKGFVQQNKDAMYVGTLDASSPVWLYAGGARRISIINNGNVGIGVAIPDNKFTVAKDVSAYDSEGAAQLALEGATDSTMELTLGYDVSNDKGFIQAVNWGNNYRDLLLNPLGGNVGIGTAAPNAELEVIGTVSANAYVTNGVPADYVFEADYDLKTIEDQAAFMWANKHLPALKGTEELGGQINIAERLEQSIEELEKAHVYIEQLNKADKEKDRKISDNEAEIARLKAAIEEIKQQ